MSLGLAMDTSHGEHPGWEAEDHGPVYRKIAWPSPSSVRSNLKGLGQFDAYGSMFPGTGPATSQPWWQQLLTFGTGAGQQIIRSEFPIPTYQQTAGPRGSSLTVYGQPAGANALMVGPTAIPGWVWLLGAVGVIAVLAARSR